MPNDLELRLRINADGNLSGEISKAKNAVVDLGASGRAAGQRMSTGMDQAKRSMRDVERLGRTIGTVFAMIGVSLGFREVIRATIGQENALRQLEARLKSTQGAVGITSSELRDFASQLQRVTTFGDEAILAMQGVLLSFTNIRGDVFRDATQAVLDLSVAMGQDLKSSAVQLGKALNDPADAIGALSRSGIQFTESQQAAIKAMVETNDVISAQKLILAELQTQFGGAAAAARGSLGGALKGLSNAFGDILEQKDGLDDAVASIERLTAVLSDPRTIEGFNRLAAAGVSLLTIAAEGVTEFTELGVGIGESVARAVAGPLSDIDELKRELKFFEGLRGSSILSRTRLFGQDGLIKVYDEAEIERRIAELKARLEQLTAGATPVVETPAAPSIDPQALAAAAEEDERRKEINSDLVGLYRAQLADLASMAEAAKAVADRFAETRSAINAPAANPFTAGTVLEPLNNIQAGERAIEEGDFEAAGRAAEAARQQIAALAAEGKVSKSYLNDLLSKAETVAQGAVKGQRERVEKETAQIKQVLLDAGVAAAELAKIEVGFDLAAAKASAVSLRAAIAALFAEPVVQLVQVQTVGAPGANGGEQTQAKAGGGMISGPGTATSDSILARLSNGEFVVRAAAVRHYGPDLLYRLNRMALPRFAAGGLIGAGVDTAGVSGSGEVIELHVGGRVIHARAVGPIEPDLLDILRREAAAEGVD